MKISERGLIAIIVVSGLMLLGYVYKISAIIAGITLADSASSVGIIGGADGPTAIFLSSRTLGILNTIILFITVVAEPLVYLFALIASSVALARGKRTD